MTKKGKVILFTTIGVVTLTLGTLGGILLATQVFAKHEAPIVEKTIADYEKESDYNALFEELSTSLNKRTSSDLFESTEPLKIVQYALSKKVNESYILSTTTGTSKALIATQDIKAKYVKDGNSHYEENISTGLVNTAKSFRFDGNDISIFEGTINGEEVSWSSTPVETLNKAEFKEKWGMDYSLPTTYLICNDSFKKGEKTIGNDEVTITLELDPTISALKYVKQQKLMGGLDELPVFTKVKQTYTINKDFQITSIVVDESSQVKKGLWVNNSSQMTNTFTYTK